MKAEILAVGSELCTPFRTDTNSLWLTERLNELGIEVQARAVAADQIEVLSSVLAHALERSDLVLTTGGLGPTLDDLTRDAVARVTGLPLVTDEQVLQGLRERFARRGYPMTANNERQACLPAGSRVLPNPNGTAPGFRLERGTKRLYVMPGPPREMQPMFLDHVLPELTGGQGVVRRRTLRVNGLGESALDEKIAPLYQHLDNPTTTILFTEYDLEIHLTARAACAQEADRLLTPLAESMRAVLGTALYSLDGTGLPELLLERLKRREQWLAVAESCTGGLLAERLTAVSGASRAFRGGVVAYSEAAKQSLLGVSPDTLARHTVYSAQVAEEMARGARDRLQADYALGVTGVAGPQGGSEEAPVGTVFVGLAGPEGVESRRFDLPGDRHLIRTRASQAALDWLRRRYLPD